MMMSLISLSTLYMLMMLVAQIHSLKGACSVQSHEDGVRVDCSYQQMTSLPSTWPVDVVWLDLSHNQLTSLTNLSSINLTSLRHLDLSYNQLKGVLDNFTFASLHSLQWLDLHYNHLQVLGVNAFSGLAQLTYLDLSNNALLLDYDTYPAGVFEHLGALQELHIHYNEARLIGEYPDDIFRPLTKLQILSMDTFSSVRLDSEGPMTSPFGPGFARLKNLRDLRLNSQHSRLDYVSNSTLEPFRGSSLETLRLGSYALMTIDACAFCGFLHLKSLYINGYNAPLTRILPSLYGLQRQNMTIIDVSSTDFDRGVDLTEKDTRYLRNICVSRLIVAHTKLQWIQPGALYQPNSLMVQCLQELDASRNRIYGNPLAIMLLLSGFRQLSSLRVDRQQRFTVSSASCFLRQDWDCADPDPRNTDNTDFHITPSLVYLNVSSVGGRLGSLPAVARITEGNSLKVFDVSYTRITDCRTTFVGFKHLETLVLSGNYCYKISENIFDDLRQLRRLELSDSNFDLSFFRVHAWRMFQNLEMLRTLDLSFNNLIHVDPDMLRAQRHLTKLNMAGNRLQSLSLNLEPLHELELLDLSHNMLPTLLPAERDLLDTLASGRDFHLRLSRNPLLCACSNLDFVSWLWKTKVKLDGDGEMAGNYTCVTETGEVSDTHSVMTHYTIHWRRCVGQSMLGMALAAFLLQLLLLMGVYVASRSWTYLVYVWKVIKRLRLPRREDFRKDAYVGYADADWEFACVTLRGRLEEDHGVRLLLRDREELPGSIRAENIVEHIDDSWKVLLLVTRHFAEDGWLCGFTVHQAQYSITDTMPDRVIVLFLEDPARLPPMASLERLLRMVPEKNVLHVHRYARLGPEFWCKLAGDILGRDENRH